MAERDEKVKLSPYEGKIPGIYFMDNEYMSNPNPSNRDKDGNIILVDDWNPEPDEILVTCIPGFFMAPISVYSGVEYFWVNKNYLLQRSKGKPDDNL